MEIDLFEIAWIVKPKWAPNISYFHVPMRSMNKGMIAAWNSAMRKGSNL
jgi:hypothetical protein